MTRSFGDRTSAGRGGALTVLVLLGSLLAGCGGGNSGDQGAASGSTSSRTSASASGTSGHDDTSGHEDDSSGHATAQPPFPADTRPDTQQASADAFGNVTDVGIGHHDGFDRVVLSFGGRGTPGWDVRYVDQPASQGSGAPIDLAGGATLQATVTGVGLPPDTGVQEYSGPRRFSGHDTDAVTEVLFDGTFEGTTVVFVGTAATTPFRVYLLSDPVRIVIDVAHAS